MWNYICPELLKAVDSEPELDIKSEHMSALAQCIEHMGSGCLTAEQVEELVTILDTKILKEHFDRQDKRMGEEEY